MIKNTLKTGKSLILAATAVAALALSGCASPTHRQIGIGAGAVAGGAVGNVLFGGPIGTIGGAAAGALIGNELTSGHRR